MQLNSEHIKDLRTQNGWTQQQLADIANISMRTVQRVELHGIASLETSKALAAAFEVPREQLLQTDFQQEPVEAKRQPPPAWLLGITFVAGALSGALIIALIS